MLGARSRESDECFERNSKARLRLRIEKKSKRKAKDRVEGKEEKIRQAQPSQAPAEEARVLCVCVGAVCGRSG